MPEGESLKALGETIKLAYTDAAQPAAKELGQAVGEAAQLVRRTVSVALAPLKGLVWSFEEIAEYVQSNVTEKLRKRDVPAEQIVTPPPYVAVPSLQGLHYCGSIPELREMFASLLATSMNSATVSQAHPSFAEIIRQLTPDEAKILNRISIYPGISLPMVDVEAPIPQQQGHYQLAPHFSLLAFDAGCEHPELLPEYIDNFCRLGLVVIPAFSEIGLTGAYDAIESHPMIQTARTSWAERGTEIKLTRRALSKTQFGRQFFAACLE